VSYLGVELVQFMSHNETNTAETIC